MATSTIKKNYGIVNERIQLYGTVQKKYYGYYFVLIPFQNADKCNSITLDSTLYISRGNYDYPIIISSMVKEKNVIRIQVIGQNDYEISDADVGCMVYGTFIIA